MKNPNPDAARVPKVPLATPARFRMIKENVCAVHGVKLEQIDSPSRGTARVAFARQHAMALARLFLVAPCPVKILISYVSVPLQTIAREFGRDDHGTVMHACKVVSERKEIDADFRFRHDLVCEAIRRNLMAEELKEDAAR